MSLTQPLSMRRSRLPSARPSSSLRRTVTQTQPLFILSEEEKAFLKTHFEAGYEPLFMKWFLQTSEQKKLLAQATGAQYFEILPFPTLNKNLSDSVLLKNEKLRINHIIDTKTNIKPKSEDADVINDLKLLLKGDTALIIMHAKSHIYEGWQDLINLKVLQRF